LAWNSPLFIVQSWKYRVNEILQTGLSVSTDHSSHSHDSDWSECSARHCHQISDESKQTFQWYQVPHLNSNVIFANRANWQNASKGTSFWQGRWSKIKMHHLNIVDWTIHLRHWHWSFLRRNENENESSENNTMEWTWNSLNLIRMSERREDITNLSTAIKLRLNFGILGEKRRKNLGRADDIRHFDWLLGRPWESISGYLSMECVELLQCPNFEIPMLFR
jgi:hypothetical protein